jgi:hypothetical protein
MPSPPGLEADAAIHEGVIWVSAGLLSIERIPAEKRGAQESTPFVRGSPAVRWSESVYVPALCGSTCDGL